jgi:nucleotide-binding universal stress UspA family protein
MNRLQQILVGLDFSPSCRTALAQAARLARLNGAALEAVHVVDLRSVRDYAEVTDQPLMLAEKEVTERMEKELAKWCAAVRNKGQTDYCICACHDHRVRMGSGACAKPA